MKNYFVHFIIFLLLNLSFSISYADPPPLKIGVNYGFTGPAAQWSKYGRMGLELALEEINNAGGINGQKLELIYEDNKTQPKESVLAYKKLVKVDGVKIVLGAIWDFLTIPLIPLAAKDNVTLISTVMKVNFNNLDKNFFSLGSTFASMEPATDLFFKKNPNLNTAAIVYWDDPWGEAHLDMWRKVAKNNGVEIIDEVPVIDFGTTYASEVTRLKAKNPQIIIVGHLIERFVSRLKEQRFSPALLTTSNIVEAIYEGKTPFSLVDGVYYVDWQPSAEFRSKFLNKFGKEPILEAHNHYEILRAVSKALAINPKDISSALRQVKYEGVAGAVDFSSGNFSNKGQARLFQVTNSALNEVK